MAQRVSRGKVVLFGLLAGGLFGVTHGLQRDSLWAGVVFGALFGAVMAVSMRRVWGSTALRGLNFGERRAVSRAMRQGVPVEDPRLARPLVDQADAVLATPFPLKTLRVMFALPGLLGLVVGVLGFLDEGPAGLVAGVPLLVIALVLLFVVIPFGLRQRERVRRSRDVTRERYQLSEVE
ncbi:hypothetical protein [Saccharothrix australiensis]|uniref:Uncharacterized protein n=1 Tax=Saccharothrix australiensis TaxID=2072 RepID=A0A495W303_9PSEU|nr:hypothetical protein [Saccharothrix australiensis]RKT54208.1 hypothetical protein C8E97_2823 [Saccharothrix australiensis]